MTPEQTARLRALDDWINAAPDPEEQSSPKARERAAIERSTRIQRRLTFANAVSVETKWGPIYATVFADYTDLLAAETKFADTVATLEGAYPEPERQRMRYEDMALREAVNALKAVRLGVEWIGSMEMIPSSLRDFLARERGWTPREGAFWRGSLSSLEDRVRDVEQRLNPARAAIEAEMARTLEEVTA